MFENGIYAGYLSQTHRKYVKVSEAESDTEEPKGFKEQIEALAKEKTPQEMTLREYRQYLKEKIEKMCPFAPHMSSIISISFSDMALVLMKNDPECEKMVLEAIQYMAVREKDSALEIELAIQRTRERKTEKKNQQKEILLKKKRLEIFFVKRKLRRENYTEFLETGKRYATPCPAAEIFAAAQMTGGISFF